MTIEVYKSHYQKSELPHKGKDIIKKIPYEEVTYEGNKEIKETKYKLINITKMVNESSKLIKEKTASEKLVELASLLEKENKK